MTDSTINQAGQDKTRRDFLKLALALVGAGAGTALLNACGAGAATAVATLAPATQQPTTLPTGAATSTTAATATTATAAVGATAATGASATPAIVAATNAFLATLDDTQRTAVSFPYPTDQTAATAANFGFRVGEQFGQSVWSNYPTSDVIRPGIKMGDLTAAQRQAVLAILAAALSQQGYQKVQNIMAADQMLSSGGANYAAGTDSYLVGLFGAPSASERWMLQFGGHHLGLNVTMQGDQQTMAPTLTGCQPATFTSSDGQTTRPLGGETDKAFALINALNADQQKQAILSYAVSDLVLGPGHDGQTLQPEGIPASSLTADQQAMLLDLVGEWVNIINDTAAQTKMADIKSHISDTYFAWSGATAAGSAVYFRVTGPTLVIEFAHQGTLGGGPGGGAPNGTPGAGFGGANGTPGAGGPGGANGTPGAGFGGAANATPGASGTVGATGSGQQNPYEAGGVNHIHTVYRDPTNEYGTGLS